MILLIPIPDCMTTLEEVVGKLKHYNYALPLPILFAIALDKASGTACDDEIQTYIVDDIIVAFDSVVGADRTPITEEEYVNRRSALIDEVLAMIEDLANFYRPYMSTLGYTLRWAFVIERVDMLGREVRLKLTRLVHETEHPQVDGSVKYR